MSLLDLYSERIDQSIQRDLTRPPVADEPQSFNAWSFMAAGAKGVPRGGLQGAGSVSDLLSGFGTALAATGPSGEGMFSTGTEAEKSQAQQASAKLAAGQAIDPAAGNALRRKANEFMPDPQSSSKADQVVNGLSSSVTKAATAITLMGPLPGAAAFGAEEANTTYRELIEKGVDEATAMKVAGITGVASGVGAAIPVGGATVAQTMGLVLASGPATFVAQEKLSHDILEKAGYKDESSLHNPTDPLGLALSTVIPFAFGAAHAAGIKSKAKAPEAINTEADVKAAVQLNPAEQAASDAFERSATNIAELRTAINAETRPEAKAILEAELATQVGQAQKHAREVTVQRGAADPEVVDAARVQVTNEAFYRSLPEHEQAYADVMRVSDEVAAGRVPELEPAYSPPKADDEHIAQLPEGRQEQMVQMYSAAAREKPAFDAAMNTLAREIGGEAKLSNLKGTERAVAKVASDYGGDPTKIKDLLRATIKVDSAEAAQRAVAGIFERFEVLPSGRRNLLDPTKQPADGYRDAKFNVMLNGHVAEVQVNLPAMLKAKKEVHSVYAEREALVRESRDRGETLLTPDLAKKIDELNARMKSVYDQAWAEATSARKSDSETSEPLRYIDSTGKERGSAASQATTREGLTPAPSETGIPSTSKNLASGGNLAGRDSFISTSESILPKPEAAGLSVTRRATALVEADPSLKVRLPGSEETLTVGEAMQRAKEEFDHDAGEAGLVEAALKCVLG